MESSQCESSDTESESTQLSKQSESTKIDLVDDLVLDWKRLYEMLDGHPKRELNVIKAYKLCGFEMYFHESFNGNPEPGDDSEACFTFESHYPGADEYDLSGKSDALSKATKLIVRRHYHILRPHIRVARDAGDEARNALEPLMAPDMWIMAAKDEMRQRTVHAGSTVLIKISALHRHLHAIAGYKKHGYDSQKW